jgi:F-type H+-transporting ATPase subunit b
MKEMLAAFAQSFVNIAVIFIVLRLFIYKPVYNYLHDRSERISKQLDDANETLRKANDSKNQLATELKKTTDEASEESKQIISEAKTNAAQIIAAANTKAEEILAAAKNDADSYRSRMMSDTNYDFVTLSAQMAAKVIEREISLEDNERIINSYLTEVKNRAKDNS